MCPLGTDTQPVRLLYGPTSKIGLNIFLKYMKSKGVEVDATQTAYDLRLRLPVKVK